MMYLFGLFVGGVLLGVLGGFDDVVQFVFFEMINDFIWIEIDIFQWNLL